MRQSTVTGTITQRDFETCTNAIKETNGSFSVFHSQDITLQGGDSFQITDNNWQLTKDVNIKCTTCPHPTQFCGTNTVFKNNKCEGDASCIIQ